MFLWNSQCDEINQTGANKYWKKKIESLIKSAFGELNVAQQKTKQNKAKQKKKNGSNNKWSVWGLNSRPWRYQHHALPTELTDHMFLRLQNSPYFCARRACEARAFRARKTLTDFEKKTDCFAVYMFLWKDVPFSMIWTLHNGHSRLRVPDPEASRCSREKPLVTTKLKRSFFINSFIKNSVQIAEISSMFKQ